jgi:hypothetical protein
VSARYDIALTVELTQKQLQRLQDAEYVAEYSDENMPLWLTGKAATRFLRRRYGVKAKLVRWTLRRNTDEGRVP